ncbi:MAG: efflux RND transporter periplasmic adaptor subunit [Candidatus Eisenbacteria bacterium]
MKKWILIGLLVAIAFLVWGLTRGRGNATEYRMVEVTRGNVRSVVSSTGALQAITTVEVGTQVSGKIAEIYVDFNDHVVRDQLIARIDPQLLEQSVRAAEADLERSQAELAQMKRELDRIALLYERQVTTETEYNTAQYKHEVAQASLKSSEINLERARQNLSYTEIRAPINGVVIDRTVDVGQTVAASFSAPQLFLIAEDLSAMEILAAVDESDIGRIVEGQEVEFSVQGYPDETFTGTVSQIRLKSTTQENIVNYTAVVSVSNPDGRLLPGMTATVEFIVSRATDVLRVPNAALRFRPTEEMQAILREQLRERREQREGAGADSARGPGGWAGRGAEGTPGAASEGLASHGAGQLPGQMAGAGAGHSAAGPSDRAMLWYVNEQGKPAVAFVRSGITDGQYTEVSGPAVKEGMQVIAAVGAAATSSTAANPFQQQQQGPPGPPRVF